MAKKAANYWLCFVLLGLMTVSAPAANILFISAMDTATQASDALLKTFMEGLGHTVTYLDDNANQADTRAAALASDMVFISESVSSSQVGNEIDNIPKPMVITEMYVWDEMGMMVDPGASPTFENTNIQIVKPGHLLAAGLQGSVSVLKSLTSSRGAARFASGKVGGGGVVIAQATALGVTYDMYMVYDKGVALAKAPGDGSAAFAADIRIGLGLDELSYLVWNDNAFALLRASINYALGISTRGPATVPVPADTTADVARDAVLQWTPGPYAATHDVYLGTSFADVNAADRTTPKGVLVSQGQDANTYDPPSLQFGQTYYWRVDEVNAPPSTKIFKGSVWSFTVEPIARKLTGVTATASSAESTAGPENAVNGAGLDNSDLHGTLVAATWLSSRSAGLPWIQFTFDRAYKLYQLWIWNHNSDVESLLGLGIKDATIQYSTNGTDWTTLGDYQFARAPGAAGYAHNTTIDLSGVMARQVRITAKSSWGGGTQCGLSEVRFLYVPVWARYPNPVSGATGIALNATLAWRAGREAASHSIYFGADPNALAPAGTAATNSYTPANLSLGTKYYWRVDEVNAAATPSTWTGDVWNFTTLDYLVVDDMEGYTADETAGKTIYQAWVDGYGTSTNGAVVGYATSANGTFGETTIIHGGKQSMPFAYDNTGTHTGSEATRTFANAQDWTQAGAKVLVVYFRGDAANTTTQLYVKVNSTKINYSGASADLAVTSWKQWNVDLTSVSNLKAVKTLALGTTGSTKGILYFDDIRLYKTAP